MYLIKNKRKDRLVFAIAIILSLFSLTIFSPIQVNAVYPKQCVNPSFSFFKHTNINDKFHSCQKDYGKSSRT